MLRFSTHPALARLVTLLLLAPLAGPLQCLAVEAASANASESAKFDEVAASPSVFDALRRGGLVLYMRHGPTDNSRTDRVPLLDVKDCSQQRQLSAEGRALAERVGHGLRLARIPIAEMHISPLCRVVDTAQAAFPRLSARIDVNLMYTANLTDAQKQPILRRTRQLLSDPVPLGSNRLVIAHGPNLMDLIGYFPKEATLVVFRPMGEGRFEYLGSIAPTAWPIALRNGALP